MRRFAEISRRSGLSDHDVEDAVGHGESSLRSCSTVRHPAARRQPVSAYRRRRRRIFFVLAEERRIPRGTLIPVASLKQIAHELLRGLVDIVEHDTLDSKHNVYGHERSREAGAAQGRFGDRVVKYRRDGGETQDHRPAIPFGRAIDRSRCRIVSVLRSNDLPHRVTHSNISRFLACRITEAFESSFPELRRTLELAAHGLIEPRPFCRVAV